MSAAGLLATEADRAALAEVLASPEFQAQRWRGEALRRWLVEWWDRLIELLGTAEAEQWAELGRAVFLAAVAVGLLLLWRAARKRRVAAGPAARGGAAALPTPAAPDVAAALAAAGRALADGRPGEAVRQAFLAATRAIGGRLRTTAVEMLTGRELSRLVADQGFGQLAGLHERTIFGRRPVTAAEAAEALAVAVRLASGGAGPATPARPAGRGEVAP